MALGSSSHPASFSSISFRYVVGGHDHLSPAGNALIEQHKGRTGYDLWPIGNDLSSYVAGEMSWSLGEFWVY